MFYFVKLNLFEITNLKKNYFGREIFPVEFDKCENE